MHSLQDERHLQEAIRTMLSQLCRVGLVFESELSIAGTLGVTIDKKSVVLVHFDEQYGCDGPKRHEDSRHSGDSAGLPATDGESELRLLGAEALYSLQDYFSPPLPGNSDSQPDACSTLQQITKECVDSKRPQSLGIDDVIPIDDSDSESFAGLPFDVDTYENVDVKAMDIKHFVRSDDHSGVSPESEPFTTATAEVSVSGTTDASHSKTETSPMASDAAIDHVTMATTTSRPRTGDRRRACDVCGRVFAGVAALESHLVGTHGVTRTPSGERIPYLRCGTCDRKFRFRCLLEKHARAHDADRPHRCPHCSNTYRRGESLAVHARVHAGDSLACHLCNKGYASRKLFQKHIVYMHEIKHSTNT